MKIKLLRLEDKKLLDFEKEINDFIKDRTVVNIDYIQGSLEYYPIVMIIYVGNN